MAYGSGWLRLVLGLVDLDPLHGNADPVALAHQLQLALQPAADDDVILAQAEAPDVQAHPALIDVLDVDIVRALDARVDPAQRIMDARKLL